MPRQGGFAMHRILLLLAMLSLAFAPVPKPRPDSSTLDLKAIQGEWVLVARISGGNPSSHCVALVKVSAGEWTYLNADGSWKKTWSLSLDARKSPRHFDSKYKQVPFEVQRGIYKICGDTLTMCYTHGVMGMSIRPNEFGEQEEVNGSDGGQC